LNFGHLLLRSRQHEVGRDRNARMRDQAKGAIGMRIRGGAVCMNDLYCREESDKQQTNESENPLSEVPGAGVESELEHQILNL